MHSVHTVERDQAQQLLLKGRQGKFLFGEGERHSEGLPHS